MNWMRRYNAYGAETSSHDVLKFVALLLMIVDHLGSYFFPEHLTYRAIGRICVPIWLFLAGYANPKKILDKEIVGYCILLIFVDHLAGEKIFPINILLTVLVCRVISYLLTKYKVEISISFIIQLLIIYLIFFPLYNLFEYGTLGLAFGLAGYVVRNGQNRLAANILFIFVCIIYVLFMSYSFKFNEIEVAISSLGVFLVYCELKDYKIRACNISNGSLRSFINMIARNSLYLYFIHLSIFIYLSNFVFHIKE